MTFNTLAQSSTSKVLISNFVIERMNEQFFTTDSISEVKVTVGTLLFSSLFRLLVVHCRPEKGF